MKSNKVTVSLFALAAIFSTQFALAAVPANLSVTIGCPEINTGNGVVTNYGSVIAGPGIERLHVSGGTSDDSFPIFTAITPEGVPMDLVAAEYAVKGTGYDPNTNVVNCYYESTQELPPFNLLYTLKHISNGTVVNAGAGKINIKFTVGVKV